MPSSIRVSSAVLAAACMLGLLMPVSARSQESGNLTGRWVLNRNQSQIDKEIGFTPAWLAAGTRGAERESGGGGGRGRRGSGGGQQGGYAVPRESEEDAKRVQQLSTEARTPSPHLTIIDSRGTVTITDADDVSRTLHTDGKDDSLQIHGLPITAVTVRDSGHVVVRYKVEQGRELRYTYTRETGRPTLTVDIEFVEGGRVADTVRRVYDLIGPEDPFPTPDLTSKTEPGAVGGVPAIPPPAARTAASNAAPPEPFNQQPDAELKGLTRLGIVIEGLGAQAASCGLTPTALEATVAGKLKGAGFTVLTNTDEDSYVYVNVITGSLSTGSCVSRFDVTVYTHTTARLSYQPSPVLVQVSLLHRGGISAGASAGHSATVIKGVSEYLDEFIDRIKAANK
ncbi:MAG TPA: hypothetical protein VFT39_14600 [Vicinamibacterales bacterium]|nr:hypothetical protein [Vicinamibacterales bacterium]